VSSIGLSALQDGLADLIKDRPITVEDPYLATVADSDGLALVHEIAEWWRSLSLEQNAPLTTALLDRRGRRAEFVAVLTRNPDLSPFHAELAGRLLTLAAHDADALLSALARFERALLLAADGSLDGEVRVPWPVDPYPVLHALLFNSELPDSPPDPHDVFVGPTAADGFRAEPRAD
jgi:hypothetical protein